VVIEGRLVTDHLYPDHRRLWPGGGGTWPDAVAPASRVSL